MRLRHTTQAELDRYSSESVRKAKKTDSIPSKTSSLPLSDLTVFDCVNFFGTRKTMNCTKPCSLCMSEKKHAVHIEFLCPQISNARERKQTLQPRNGPTEAICQVCHFALEAYWNKYQHSLSTHYVLAQHSQSVSTH